MTDAYLHRYRINTENPRGRNARASEIGLSKLSTPKSIKSGKRRATRSGNNRAGQTVNSDHSALNAKKERDYANSIRVNAVTYTRLKSGNAASEALRMEALDIGAPDNHRGRKVVRAMARNLARRLAKLSPAEAQWHIDSDVDPEYREIVTTALATERASRGMLAS